jgi:hypothetical protein
MDLLLELLEDPAYRHVLLNHLPIVGLAIAWLVLAWALIEGRWSSTVFGLSLVAVLSGSAIGVMSAGDAAYPFVFDSLDGPGREWLDYHTYLGDRWGWLIATNGALAILAIVTGFMRERLRRVAGVTVLATTLVGLATAAIIAEAGGKIRHPEFRLSDPPVYESPGRIR